MNPLVAELGGFTLDRSGNCHMKRRPSRTWKAFTSLIIYSILTTAFENQQLPNRVNSLLITMNQLVLEQTSLSSCSFSSENLPQHPELLHTLKVFSLLPSNIKPYGILKHRNMNFLLTKLLHSLKRFLY